jgi:carotenoid cleavage dioxygenase-like enzyme
MSLLFFLFIFALTINKSSSFLNIKFGIPFRISDKEIKKDIDYQVINKKEQNIIKKINGFYGLIGPDINKTEVKTLYDLFTGNGNIQGLFFKDGRMSYVKYFIRTERIVYEETHGKIPNHLFLNALLMCFNKINLFPNILGFANTALLNIKDKNYALFEQDSPYMIDINFKNHSIKTIKKLSIPGVHHFSAHSKYNSDSNTIDTIDYDAVTNLATYYQLDSDFNILKKKDVCTKYIPLVHDFVSLNNSIIFCDAPMLFNMQKMSNIKIPVTFYKNKNTFIHIIDKNTLAVKKIEIEDSIYIFHYADYEETDKTIEMYASLYENIDYGTIDIKGRYRKIVIDKDTDVITIIKNPLLEKYNLDFPVKFENKQILIKNNNNSINGFLVCDGLKIIKDFCLPGNLCIAGEPKVIYIEKIPYFISFAYSSETDDGWFLLVNLQDYKQIKIPLNERINIGFHSIFMDNAIR